MSAYSSTLLGQREEGQEVIRREKSKIKKMPRVAVVGLGYVGLPLALTAEKRGFPVWGIDIDKEKLRLIRSRIAPMRDPAVAQSLKERALAVTADFQKARSADIIILCVPTPVDANRKPDLGPVTRACAAIGLRLRKGQLVVLESTVNPGVSEDVVLPLLEKHSGLTGGKDFFLAHCPERINPGDPDWTIETIPRVIGGLTPESAEKARMFYSSFVSAPLTLMASLKEAESVKIVENAFRDVNIAFVNELARSFDLLGIDILNVIRGASTKPFGYMDFYPGCGVGGHCVPVDPRYLIAYAEKNGFRHSFLSLARRINDSMPEFTISLVRRVMRALGLPFTKKTKIALLGLAFKPNLDDSRESPALEILKELKRMGVKAAAYDPLIKGLSTAKTLSEALEGSALVVIATAHDAFRALNPRILAAHGTQAVIDGRNCLNKEEFAGSGIVYKGIGR